MRSRQASRGKRTECGERRGEERRKREKDFRRRGGGKGEGRSRYSSGDKVQWEERERRKRVWMGGNSEWAG